MQLLKGNLTVPSKEEMLEDSKPNNLKHPHDLGDLQWDYNDSLAIAAGIDCLPVFYKNGFSVWNITRTTNYLRYKDSEIIIENDGKIVNILI